MRSVERSTEEEEEEEEEEEGAEEEAEAVYSTQPHSSFKAATRQLQSQLSPE